MKKEIIKNIIIGVLSLIIGFVALCLGIAQKEAKVFSSKETKIEEIDRLISLREYGKADEKIDLMGFKGEDSEKLHDKVKKCELTNTTSLTEATELKKQVKLRLDDVPVYDVVDEGGLNYSVNVSSILENETNLSGNAEVVFTYYKSKDHSKGKVLTSTKPIVLKGHDVIEVVDNQDSETFKKAKDVVVSLRNVDLIDLEAAQRRYERDNAK